MVDPEKAILCSILIDKDAMVDVIDFLLPEHFREWKHKVIFKAMVDLFNKKEPIDIVTVVGEIKRDDSNHFWGSYTSDLLNEVPTSVHTGRYGKMLADQGIDKRFKKGGE